MSISVDKLTTGSRIDVLTAHAQTLLLCLKHAALNRLRVRFTGASGSSSSSSNIYCSQGLPVRYKSLISYTEVNGINLLKRQSSLSSQ